jgi:hexulose-6-phosphate isomerase
MTEMDRRTLLRGTGAALAAGLVGGAAGAYSQATASTIEAEPMKKLELKFAVGYGMIGGQDMPMVEKFRIAKRAGFDGIEMDCPNPWPDAEVVKAVAETGIPVHSVVDSVHWKSTLSHDDPAQREKGVAGLETAIRGAKAYGASNVLLVPAVVGGKVTHEQAWERSIEGIRRVLPLAAELGIFILIENVWNRFGYDHDGPVDQPADRLAAYVDEIDSPWVRFYLDLGNHRKYASVPEWIRTLGSRIVKLHVKGYHRQNGWVDITDSDIDWPGVCNALRETGFTGWVTAEVGGGDEARLAKVHGQMTRVFAH